MKKTLREFCGESGQSQLLEQWDAQRNLPLTPDLVTYGSKQKVWRKCEKGHIWQASVWTRTGSGTYCPFCAEKMPVAGENDLQSRYPELARERHPMHNEITPQQVTPCSNRKIWWKCELGHSYQAVIGARTMRGNGCPYCTGRKVLPGFNDLATLQPEIAKQWHPALNGTLTPDQVTAGSHRKVWWQCPEGHVWQTVIYARTGSRKSGCPVCAGRVQRGKSIKYRKIIAKIN